MRVQAESRSLYSAVCGVSVCSRWPLTDKHVLGQIMPEGQIIKLANVDCEAIVTNCI